MERETKNNLSQKETRDNEPYEKRVIKSGEGRKSITVRVRKLKEFDAAKELKNKAGPFLEVAGPTEQGFQFYSFEDNENPELTDLFQLVAKDKKVYISNLYRGTPKFDATSGFIRFYGLVDFVADARNLPIKSEGLDAVFCSCLGSISTKGIKEMAEAGVKYIPRIEKQRIGSDFINSNDELRKKAIEEAARVLKLGGLLIWSGAKKQDLDFAANAGFTIAQLEIKKREGVVNPSLQAIFIKNS